MTNELYQLNSYDVEAWIDILEATAHADNSIADLRQVIMRKHYFIIKNLRRLNAFDRLELRAITNALKSLTKAMQLQIARYTSYSVTKEQINARNTSIHVHSNVIYSELFRDTINKIHENLHHDKHKFGELTKEASLPINSEWIVKGNDLIMPYYSLYVGHRNYIKHECNYRIKNGYKIAQDKQKEYDEHYKAIIERANTDTINKYNNALHKLRFNDMTPINRACSVLAEFVIQCNLLINESISNYDDISIHNYYSNVKSFTTAFEQFVSIYSNFKLAVA